MIGLYIRNSLSETPLYTKIRNRGLTTASPLKEILLNHKKDFSSNWSFILMLQLLLCCNNFYSKLYDKPWITTRAKVQFRHGLALIIMMLSFPVAALISDKVGRKPVIFIAVWHL